MGQANVLALLEKEAKDTWSEPYPLAFSDRPFKPTEQNTVFTRHSVVFGDGIRTSIGTGFYRYQGLQYLSIFYTSGSGNHSLYKFGDNVMAHYTDRILSDGVTKVVFEVASTIKLPADANGFSQLQVICPFYYDLRS